MTRYWRRLYRTIPYPNLLLIVCCAVIGLVAVWWGVLEREEVEVVAPDPHASFGYELTMETIPRVTTDVAAFVVLRADTGAVIAEQNSTTILPLASLTKLFAATTVIENFSTTTAVVTWADLSASGEAGLIANSETTLYELLFPLLLVSSNDAAATIDRTTAGLVVTSMNDVSRSLSLDTIFTEPSGYDAGNVGSALSVARFTRYLFDTHPHLLDITTLRQYVGSETVWQNNNPLVGEAGYRGGKNGYTIPANRTMTALFDEQFTTPDGVSVTIPLIYVALGSPDADLVIRELRTFVAENAELTVTPMLRTRPTEAPLVY